MNTRNANDFTGKQGYESLKKLSETVSTELTKKQEQDEDAPKKISSKDIIFGCTGTIGENLGDKSEWYCYIGTYCGSGSL